MNAEGGATRPVSMCLLAQAAETVLLSNCSTWPKAACHWGSGGSGLLEVCIEGTVEPPGDFILGEGVPGPGASSRNWKGGMFRALDGLGFLGVSDSEVGAGAGDGQGGSVGRPWVSGDGW